VALTPDRIARAGVLAAILEAAAPKPGNVSPRRPARDATFLDFAASALAIEAPLAAAAAGRLAPGAAVRAAVEATRSVTRSNTNLGVVLLLVPLARAAAVAAGPGDTVTPAALRAAVGAVLEGLGVDDAREAYAAIRVAAPGGLGRAEAQDVGAEPTVPLREAMRLAADRDDVAREYAEGYPTTFEVGLPALRAGARLGPERAAVQAALAILAERPDTLIARKAGALAAQAASAEARAALDAGGVRTPEGRRRLRALDRTLRRGRGRLNPGTTADLVAASLFVWFLESGGGPTDPLLTRPREGTAGAARRQPPHDVARSGGVHPPRSRGTLALDRLYSHGADLELRDLAVRVEGVVREDVRRRLVEVERDEDASRRHAAGCTRGERDGAAP
jgi:triphosphoribosyl-dephospho-CoA synthase